MKRYDYGSPMEALWQSTKEFGLCVLAYWLDYKGDMDTSKPDEVQKIYNKIDAEQVLTKGEVEFIIPIFQEEMQDAMRDLSRDIDDVSLYEMEYFHHMYQCYVQLIYEGILHPNGLEM